jgi:uncharacterized membrane protein HdeD (DUF308 family)
MSSNEPNDSQPKAEPTTVSFLPLVLVVAAYLGNYVYVYVKDDLQQYIITGRALILLHERIFFLTIFSVVATIVYYVKRTNKTKMWALGISAFQIIAAFLAMYNVLHRHK